MGGKKKAQVGQIGYHWMCNKHHQKRIMTRLSSLHSPYTSTYARACAPGATRRPSRSKSPSNLRSSSRARTRGTGICQPRRSCTDTTSDDSPSSRRSSTPRANRRAASPASRCRRRRCATSQPSLLALLDRAPRFLPPTLLFRGTSLHGQLLSEFLLLEGLEILARAVPVFVEDQALIVFRL